MKFFPHLQSCFTLDPNLLQDTSRPVFTSMDFLTAFQPDTVTLTPPLQSPLYERKLRTYNREIQTHKIWNQGGFDGFISVSSYDPTTFLQRCVERVELSGNIVVYSPFREPIVELQNFILTKMPTRPILAPAIYEVRAEKWSTLKGRVRPDMIGRGGGGMILGGIRVEESEVETRDWSDKRKKRKVQVNGHEMEVDSAVEIV
jgi:tRNA (adenine58-N1)-methyltransferase non-catalytic subunit